LERLIKLNKKKFGLLFACGAISAVYYFSWWFELDRIYHPLFSTLLILAVLFCLVQVFFQWYIFLQIKRPDIVEAPSGLSVDVYIPTYDEPLWLVERTLSAVLAIRYPHRTYLIDDGHKAEYRKLAERLGAQYLSRPGNEHHKAGNVNYALAHSKGDFIAIFDVDHVPGKNFLDRALGPFRDPEVGFVQVMLSHYNHSDSFVAAAAAQRNDGFFGAVMLGLHGCVCVQAFGSNCIFRRQALESIGGYQPGLAEDLHTSIHLHAQGWRSYYVPEILAEGLEPIDLTAFYKQQFKWSLGVFHILWGIYPRLARKLSLKMNIGYLWRLTCFLAGPAVAIHLLFTILVLFLNSVTASADFVDYLKHWTPFILMSSFITFFVDKNYRTAPVSSGFPLAGLFLAFGTWPVYTLSFFCSILGIRVPFMATPKEATGGNFLKLILPQVITVLALLAAVVWRVIQRLDVHSLIITAFALMLILWHGAIFYAVYENWHRRRQMKFVPSPVIRAMNLNQNL
jgi:cellulose synthase (UDP-forming)